MPQSPLAFVATNPSGAITSGKLDPARNLLVNSGGQSSTLNVTAATVIKATPGTLARLTVVTAPTASGALTINDCTTTGAATAANTVFSIPYGSATAGLVVALEWPCTTGIVVSAVGGGTPQYSISWS